MTRCHRWWGVIVVIVLVAIAFGGESLGAEPRGREPQPMVRRIQAYLDILGYQPGPVDGVLGSKTRDAIRRFQRDAGFEATGEIAQGWVDALSARTLRRAQRALKDAGYKPGTIDGKLGPRTAAAIRSFEQRAGLPVTGELSETLLNNLIGPGTEKVTEIRGGGTREPVRVTSFTRGSEVMGPMRFQRNDRGALTGCAVKDVQLDLSWCQTFSSLGHKNACRVGMAGARVLHVKCK